MTEKTLPTGSGARPKGAAATGPAPARRPGDTPRAGAAPAPLDTTAPTAHPGLLLAVLLVGVFMALLDSTIVNVAAPDMQASLHLTGSGIQLAVAAYTVAYAVLIVTGARLGNLFGHRRAFLAGLAGFTAASLACGLAQNGTEVIVFRAIQGTAAASMLPQVLSLIQRNFTGESRMRALSSYATVVAIGAVTGQVLGGVLVSANLFGTGWRPVFLLNVPVGVALLLLGRRGLPADRGERTRRVDLPGTAVLALAVLAAIIPLVLGHQRGWPAWCWALLAAAAPLFGLFALVERRVARRGGTPMVPGDVITAPRLVPALIALGAGMATYGGTLFVITLHMQSGLGYSAAHAGLAFAPAAVGFGAMSVAWGRLPAHLHRLAAPLGLLVAGASYLGLREVLQGGDGIGALALLLFGAMGVGLGAAFSPLLTAALSRVPLSHAADASGVVATWQQLSLATGLAVFGSLYLGAVGHPHGTAAVTSGHAIGGALLVLTVTAVVGALVSLRALRR